MSYLKELFSISAILLTFYAYFPYVKSVLDGKTKPHVFTWVIWGVTTFIIFLAQLSDDGGLGAYPIGISGIIALYVATLAYFKRSDITITKIDWLFFIISLFSLPIWYFTSDALLAVIILLSIDVIGFFPTIRKAYHSPFEEQMLLYVLMSIRNFLTILALENYSAITLLFPITINITNVIFITIIMIRRAKAVL